MYCYADTCKHCYGDTLLYSDGETFLYCGSGQDRDPHLYANLVCDSNC